MFEFNPFQGNSTLWPMGKMHPVVWALKPTKLSINISKKIFMILGIPHMTPTKHLTILNVTLNITALEWVKFTKFLGVLRVSDMENTLTAYLKPFFFQAILVNKLKHCIPYRILHIIYCTLISPYLSYGILIWGNTCNSYLDKLVKLQKWAIRIVSKSHYRSHSGSLFARCMLLLICFL